MYTAVEIRFIHPDIEVSDHMDDLLNACEHIRKNLEYRYSIRIDKVYFTENDSLAIELEHSDPLSNIGNRLRGIARYLFDNCDFEYEKYKVGTRLLFYTEMSNDRKKINRVVSKTFLYQSDDIRWYLVGEKVE